MPNRYAKYGCPKCGKTTKICWTPAPNPFEKKFFYTPDELEELKRSRTPRTDKPIPCRYCKHVVHVEKNEDGRWEYVR